MKTNRAFLTLILSLLMAGQSMAQESKAEKKERKRMEFAELINSKHFVFEAQSASPMSGRQINLTSMYDLRISGDSVISDLPYFGRAFVAPINSSDAGIHFTSTDNTYTSKQAKKGGWDITILPKNAQDIRQIFLSVSPDGYASLNVTSNNRQNIRFNGIIRRPN